MSQANDVLWRRLGYMLSPQLDIYKHLAPHVANLNVLEVGFGTGFGTLQLAGTAHHVWAAEIDEAAIRFAKDTLSVQNVDWLCMDIALNGEAYPYCQAAVMIEVLEHIQNWEEALHNIRNKLVDGGKLYMSARNANADLRKNDLHEREWTGQELAANLSRLFKSVRLFDYTLAQEVAQDTRQTPLMAVAEK